MFPQFDKYEGLGNDFVVVSADQPLRPADAARICDRHFGIGADGVLVLTPPANGEARARMTVLNADGSRPEMCGNGLRCVVLHLAREDDVANAEYVVETDAGARRCAVVREGPEAQVVLSMGSPRSLGVLSDSRNGRPYAFQRVSVGNPHAVLLDADVTPGDVDTWAPRVSAAIPGGANVEFVTARADGGFDVLVWERGVGRTLACGTGAAAVAWVLAMNRRVQADAPVRIHLPGGPLELVVAPTGEVTLRGPARHVFSGTLNPDLVMRGTL